MSVFYTEINSFSHFHLIFDLDACHIKVPHNDVIRIATAITKDNSLIIVVFVIVIVENFDYWNIYIVRLNSSFILTIVNNFVVLNNIAKDLLLAISS